MSTQGHTFEYFRRDGAVHGWLLDMHINNPTDIDSNIYPNLIIQPLRGDATVKEVDNDLLFIFLYPINHILLYLV
jgi:hypothetical protein